MSYIAYINNERVELTSAKDIALTKQVNDIARLDTRQSNFTHKFTLPLSAQNKKVMRNCYVIGNQSNVPYQKNRFDLIDAQSGKHLVYNGWATIAQTNDKGYEVNVYDGIVDFYKKIELLTLTDVDISKLNHTKDLDTIVASWDDTEEYKYILADYNGKLYTSSSFLNADYLVPSARIRYIWDRVHTFAGMAYQGETFLTEAFNNLYLTFPKPVPVDEPTITVLSEQDISYEAGYDPYLNFSTFNPLYLSNPFDTAEANNTATADKNLITFNIDGVFRVRASGCLTFGTTRVSTVAWGHNAANHSVIATGSIDSSVNGFIDLTVSAGDTLKLGVFPYFALWGGNIHTSVEYISGYSVNFSDALVDFMAKDFINSIMQMFGLTAYKDPYSNTIEYLTLDQVLQNTDIVDWSDKYIGKVNESYILSGYAQKNNFKYRYNDDNSNYNDGAIYIRNENIKDETTIIASNFYSPEATKTTLLGNQTNVFKFWNREVKDDGNVDYKPLAGRYYLLRSGDYSWGYSNTIGSEALGTTATFETAPIADYYRLKMQQVIFDNYSSIGNILDKSKIVTANAWITPIDYESFDFKKLVYFKQLGSYFLVNKISNFIKGVPTKLELIEVDYYSESEIIDPIDYQLQINNDLPIAYESCTAHFIIFTDLPLSCDVEIIPYALTPDGLGGLYYAPVVLGAPIVVSLTGSTLSYNFNQLPPVFGGYKFKIKYSPNTFTFVESNFSNILEIADSCYVAPAPELSYITITGIETISVIAGMRRIRITYTSDLVPPYMHLQLRASSFYPSFNFYTEDNSTAGPSGYIEVDVPNALGGALYTYSIVLTALGITSNIATS